MTAPHWYLAWTDAVISANTHLVVGRDLTAEKWGGIMRMRVPPQLLHGTSPPAIKCAAHSAARLGVGRIVATEIEAPKGRIC
jgi:hypothetical protein